MSHILGGKKREGCHELSAKLPCSSKDQCQKDGDCSFRPNSYLYCGKCTCGKRIKTKYIHGLIRNKSWYCVTSYHLCILSLKIISDNWPGMVSRCCSQVEVSFHADHKFKAAHKKYPKLYGTYTWQGHNAHNAHEAKVYKQDNGPNFIVFCPKKAR